MHPPDNQSEADLRYPIGHFVRAQVPPGDACEAREAAVQAIGALPERLDAAVANLHSAQLDTPYREGGWTLRQLTHHVADSHINAYARLRLAMTEDWPTIKPYDEARWAELPDARLLPVEPSLALLRPLHARWTALLLSLSEADWTQGYTHPESGRTTIAQMTELYSWHGRHHTAHVLALRARMGW